MFGMRQRTLRGEISGEPFDGVSPDLEAEFSAQYRRGALQGAFFAALGAALIYLAFLGVAQLSERHHTTAIAVRLLMIVVLLAVAFTIWRAPSIAQRHYGLIAGGASGIALAGTVFLLAFDPHGIDGDPRGASPALVFGLFLHYAFLRLPLWSAAGIGWTVSIANGLWGAPMVVGGNAEVRTLLYLVFANVAGMIVCRSLESRERELFLQRRRAEAAQAELGERARAAEEAHQEKTRLLAAVSHDLRQPMMAANTYVSLLQRRLQSGDLEQARAQAAQLGESIEVLRATLDHLLTAARYDSGTEPINIESVEIAPLFARLRETFATDAAARGIELRIRVPARRIVVTSDATALWRVLMNLVSNAVKFTDGTAGAGKGVLVRAVLRDGVCRIDVADTGVGIAPEHLEAIWQPYFQVANAERRRERGLGLGLFLVKRALDHLPGHRLALRSRPGRGSRFSVSMPGSSLSDGVLASDWSRPLAGGELETLHGAYVLVLEDDADARRALEALLSDWGVVFSSGATMQELLDECESSPRLPDAIVSDFRLPGGRSGLDCVGSLREHFGHVVPAVIVTGESDVASIRARLPSGVTLLQKPFPVAALAAPLAAAVIQARRAERL